MDHDNELKHACSMKNTDTQGRINLCCCYILDEEGKLEDPCYSPVEDCCCCDEGAFTK